MHLHGVFGETQFMRDLLVEQAIGQAHEHAELLRRELRELGGEIRIGGRTLGIGVRKGDVAIEHVLNRRRHVVRRR